MKYGLPMLQNLKQVKRNYTYHRYFDLYNSEVISYSISSNPTTKFTSDSLREAVSKLPSEHKLMIHSDQGFHYQHSSWVKTLESNNIKQSMSRKGNCLDNSPMENFLDYLSKKCTTEKSINQLKNQKEIYENIQDGTTMRESKAN